MSSSNSSSIDGMEGDMIAAFQTEYEEEMLNEEEEPRRPRRRREFIRRDRLGAHDRLFEDYFADDCNYPPSYFRRSDCAQSAWRKDVECAFGVLKARFNILAVLGRTYSRRTLGLIMRACVILHNMIIDDERGCMTSGPVRSWGHLSETVSIRSRVAEKMKAVKTLAYREPPLLPIPCLLFSPNRRLLSSSPIHGVQSRQVEQHDAGLQTVRWGEVVVSPGRRCSRSRRRTKKHGGSSWRLPCGRLLESRGRGRGSEEAGCRRRRGGAGAGRWSREGRPAGAPPRPTSAAAQAPPLFSMSRERGLAQPEDGGHERATARGEEVRVVAGQAGEDDQATARFTFRLDDDNSNASNGGFKQPKVRVIRSLSSLLEISLPAVVAANECAIRSEEEKKNL
ncbi:hypothetical protein QYE76_069373 [Lolium multiflorum]|uniref:Nuclease HARBI1 n=1 Tax=Lolium multiflorum TaxID=4521 RepID=A0AAD8SHV7_LOLMU|nr:hypothetical protein QYE76_069373 [Lolium multiflorum]